MSSADEGSGRQPAADGEARPSLVTLAPHFDPVNHGVYRDLIVEAVDHDPTVRNLALTGAYGVGKSSILRALSTHYGPRVVELSLASLVAATEEQAPEVTENPAATTPTNRIQREIVKQLLYRLPPSKTPQSRFPRAMKAEPALHRSVRWGAAVFVLLLGSGLAGLVVEGLVEEVWRQLIAYASLLAATVAATWLVRLYGKRVTVDSVSAGPAKVTLSPTSTSYFDEYLDEVVYFFEVSGCDIVVFEDIDRFGDPHIFETLRALNTLLNGSEQLRLPAARPAKLSEHLRALVGRFEPTPVERRIVFIYAIHDGIFDRLSSEVAAGGHGEWASERVGDLEQRDVRFALGPATAERDRVRDEVSRANRTKFFELVIPVVPFVTANNARDVLKRTMGEASRAIAPELIKLVGRHIADMRLILNIRNEFEVYHDRLFAVERRMPGLTEDLLFALIVYKNTHLDDFEAIRLQSSRLDTMYRLWRHMVNSGIKAATDRERIARSSLDGRRSNTKRAREMGKLLLKVRGGLVAGGQFGAQLSQLFLDSAPVNDDEVQTPGFWTAIANGSQLSFGAPTTRYCLTFSADDLAAFLDLPYSPDQWGEVDVATHEATIAQARRDVWSLRHDTWKKLYASEAFTVSVGGDAEGTGGKTLTFRQLAERVLESQLARELVREGYLDENFALYVSTFYGEHVRPAATEYILRCVRSGEPDTAFLLEAEDVDAILAEEGDAVLRDPSMYNLSIVDHLLGSRPRDAATVIQRLLTWGENERTFVDAYVLRGADATGLISLLAGRWPRVFKYLVAEAPVDSEQRLALFDTALQACSTERTYELGEAIRDFINDNYAALRALREPVDINRAEAAFAVVEAAGSSLRSAAGLHEFAKREVINLRLYPVTAENLTTLAASNNIALDVLLEADEHIYAHALDHQRAYLDAVRESHSTTVSTVRDFAQIINDAAEADHAAGLDEIIRSANAECTVPRLAAVPPAAWPPLCASARTASTFANVQSYVAEFGEIDESLASLLGKRKAVEWRDVPEADRLALAATIVNAGESLPGVRLQVRLIRSLNPGWIPSTSIEPNSGILVANLIRSRLVADDAEAFSPRLMVDWPTLEAAIKASRRYETFVSPAVLPAHHVASLLRSAARDEIKQAVVTDLSAYLDDADGRAARAIGEALVLKGWRLPAILIEAVRAAGARSSDVARLLGQAGDHVTVEEIRALLRTLPDPYSKLADRKGYRPSVPDDQQHRALLDRLTDVVKNHKPDLLRPGIRRVTTYRR